MEREEIEEIEAAGEADFIASSTQYAAEYEKWLKDGEPFIAGNPAFTLRIRMEPLVTEVQMMMRLDNLDAEQVS